MFLFFEVLFFLHFLKYSCHLESDAVVVKYAKAKAHLESLEKMGATILHCVNAMQMKLHTDLKMRKFDRIVFNFPHAGFKGKEEQMKLIKYV